MEKQVSLTCVAAIGLWTATFLFILSGTVVGFVTGDEHMHVILALMAHGLACSAAAATVSIRLMFKRQNKLLRDAFELGRDSAPPVRRVR